MNAQPESHLIGNRPLSLAGHLRKVALLVSSDSVIYNWGHTSHCNCGLLARSLLGYTACQLERDISQSPLAARRGTWVKRIKQATEACAFNPSVPLPTLLARLKEAGLAPNDFPHLENLNHPELRGTIFRRSKSSAANLARYCLKWADAIEAYHASEGRALSLHVGTEIAQLAASMTPPTDAEMERAESRALVS